MNQKRKQGLVIGFCIIAALLIFAFIVFSAQNSTTESTNTPSTKTVSIDLVTGLVDHRNESYHVIKYGVDGCYDYMVGTWRARECLPSAAEAQDRMIRMYKEVQHRHYMKNRTDFEIITKGNEDGS